MIIGIVSCVKTHAFDREMKNYTIITRRRFGGGLDFSYNQNLQLLQTPFQKHIENNTQQSTL